MRLNSTMLSLFSAIRVGHFGFASFAARAQFGYECWLNVVDICWSWSEATLGYGPPNNATSRPRSGLDVFCVTILAGVLEIRQFADFIVGDKCAQALVR